MRPLVQRMVHSDQVLRGRTVELNISRIIPTVIVSTVFLSFSKTFVTVGNLSVEVCACQSTSAVTCSLIVQKERTNKTAKVILYIYHISDP